MSKVGFIGMGIMGRPMSKNLLAAGHDVTVWNRTAARCEEPVKAGAQAAKTPRACAEGQEIVFICVTDSPDVEAVLFGGSEAVPESDAAVAGAAPGTIFVDMSTISPDVTRELSSRLEARGFEFLDAPVSGGDIGAQKGTLTIMCGGKESVFERVLPGFEAMGSRVTLVGPAGAGQVTKACNQILCALNLLGACEALALASRSGIDLAKMHRVVTGGAAASWQLENLGKSIIEGNYDPGFMVRLIQKDLDIVLNAARRLELPLAGAALATQYFSSARAKGHGDLGTQAMFKVLEDLGAFRLGEDEA